MGDWKRAEKLAQSGGSMWHDKPGVDVGGSYYNCTKFRRRKPLRHDRAEPARVREEARQRPRHAEVRVRQDLQRQGLQRLLANATPRVPRNAERGADQGPRRPAARPGVAGYRQDATRRPAPSCSAASFSRLLAFAAAAGGTLRAGLTQAQARALRRAAVRQPLAPARHRRARPASAGLLPRAERKSRRRQAAPRGGRCIS